MSLSILLSIALMTGADASAGPGATSSSEAAATPPSLWLQGPFGRVEGTAPEVALAPDTTPLDAWVLDAPLVLDAGERTAWFERFTVTARHVGDAEVVERLSEDETSFTGPSSPGRFLVIADAVVQGGSDLQLAWLVDVPDRPAPEDGFLDIPAPDVIVVSSQGVVTGWPGNGCYLYLCVEVGRTPPVAQLPSLLVQPGEVLAARLSDGSPIVAWKGTLRPIGGSSGITRSASGALTDAPEASIELSGLPAPGSGSWLLTLEVEFDRERGWMRTHYRLIPTE